MKEPPQREDPPEESTDTAAADEPPAVSLEEALLECMPDAPTIANLPDRCQANADFDGNANRACTEFCPSDKDDEDVAIPHPALLTRSLPLEPVVLACMPGAYEVTGRPDTATAVTDADFLDPLNVRVQDEEEEGSSASAVTPIDMEHGDQQPPAPTNLVSAYRVSEGEPPIIATPFKDNKVRNLIYGFLITAAVALLVGLSVGLTDKSKEEQKKSNPVDLLVSSVLMTAEQEGWFVKGNRYIRTENGNETVISTGSSVINWCEVLPCNEGGCDFVYGVVYKPGCCRGKDCSPSARCGGFCPRRTNLCHPSFVGCREASCFECEPGPDGEELYRYRSASFTTSCLRTGVAVGLNDKNDNVTRIYKWAILCGINVRGGSEWLNYAPDEYACIALRSGNGITKTVSQPLPCQIIQLMECGCAPDDVHTLGFLPPDKPCKTKEDCPFLCGDAGEEEAKKLCEAFPGIEWWEGENPTHQSGFDDTWKYLYGNVTIEIDIYGEG